MKQAKILTVVFAVVISCLVLCLTVSAEDDLLRQVREAQASILYKYCNNEIDYETYITKSNELTMKLYDENSASGYVSAEAEKIGNMFKGISNKIGTTAQIYGDKAYQYVADCIVDYFSDYEALSQIEATDRKGYGAMLYFVGDAMNNPYAVYCEYIVVSETGSPPIVYAEPFGEELKDYYNKDGSYESTASITWSPMVEISKCRVYGDVRYPDGSEAPTDDEFKNVIDVDFTNTPDTELDKLLQKILEELERQEPDLGNVEGLLESIYFRLGTLDQDSDNALLAEINAAILSLANSNNANTSQLILKLDELKQALTPEGDNENPEGEQQQPTDLTGVINELKEINAGIKGLAVIETVENIWELTEGEQQLFNEYASLIPLIVEKMGLSFIQASMNDIESLIFTSSPPSDLTVEMYGAEYAILSRDMFNDESLKYVNLAKNFVSVLLIYAWCLSMRKKITGGDG